MRSFGLVLAAPSLLSLSLLPLSGCGGSSSSSGTNLTTSPVIPSATYIYTLTTSSPQTVLRFSGSASGATTPSLTITLPSTFIASSLKTDKSGNVYLSGQNTTTALGEVLVYAPNATTPTTTLPVPAVGPMAVDASGNVYVAGLGTGQVYVYPTLLTGSVTSLVRAVPYTLPTGALPVDIAADSSGNIYLDFVFLSPAVPTSEIDEISGTGSSTTPIRTITLSGYSQGIAIDSSNNIYTSNTPYLHGSSYTLTGPGTIAVYGSAATPTRTITLSGSTLSSLGGVAVDTTGDIYSITATPGTGATSYSLVEFSSTQTGTASPIATQTSSSLSTNTSFQIAVF